MQFDWGNRIASSMTRLLRKNTGIFLWAFFLGAYVSIGLSAYRPHKIKVAVLPGGLGSMPPMTNESIQMAMDYYQINLPAGTAVPTLNTKLKIRGSTTRSLFHTLSKVEIGPEAFMSWGLLGSTIAHEIEVHCKQNLLWITAQEMVGINGSVIAEIEAYDYELEHSKRFGLRAFEVNNIRKSRDYHYPSL